MERKQEPELAYGPRVDYVPVAGSIDPSPRDSGWSAMFNVVRDSDKNKIGDCKEDIDTLLVFAGLYSAVLTAFLIESYKNLQPDTEDVMADLLRQLTTQRYSFDGGFLSPVSPLPEPEPFEAPLWALRVNALWFTSLILSLSTASYGMLVKQWLREYLALDYLSPLEKLRARELRSLSLTQWRVFEIAAILPLLLQVSLGLFFIGLCIFTSVVNSVVGSTTTPVVCAWAFFFFMTTLAPLLSPRCPYKTTFLKAAMRYGRRVITPTLRRVIHACSIHIQNAIKAVTSHVFKANYHPIRADIDWEELLREEDVVVADHKDDIEVLLSVDAIRCDDRMIPVMLDVLDPENVFHFVVRLINQRVGAILPTEGSIGVLDLPETLSKQTWHILTDGLSLPVLRHLRRSPSPNYPDWLLDSIILLLSRSTLGLSDKGSLALRSFFGPTGAFWQPRGRYLAKRLAQGTSGTNRLNIRLSRSLAALCNSNTVPLSGHFICEVYLPFICHDPEHVLVSLQVVRDQREDRLWLNTYTANLNDFLDTLMHIITWEASLHGSVFVDSPLVCTIASEIAHALRRYEDMITLWKLLTKCTHLLGAFTSTLASTQDAVRIQLPGGIDVHQYIMQAYTSSDAEGRKQMLDYYHFAFDAFSTIHPLQVGIYDMVRLCHRHIQFVSDVLKREHAEGTQAGLELLSHRRWEVQWAPCARAIRHYHHVEGWKAKPEQLARMYPFSPSKYPNQGAEEILRKDGDLAGECLVMIAACDEWTVDNGGGRLSAFPDELIEALALFIPAEDRSKYMRFQTLGTHQTIEEGPSGRLGGGIGPARGLGFVGGPGFNGHSGGVQGPAFFGRPGQVTGPHMGVPGQVAGPPHIAGPGPFPGPPHIAVPGQGVGPPHIAGPGQVAGPPHIGGVGLSI